MRNRTAFTLIELLVVIGIIAVLAAMLLIGTKAVIGHSKKQVTGVFLHNLQSALGEYETSAGMNALTSAGFTSAPGDVTVDAYTTTDDSTPATDPNISRWKSPAVVATQRAMGQIKRVPKNREAFGQMSNFMQAQTSGAHYAASPPTAQRPISVVSVVAGGYGTPSPELPVDAWGNPLIFVQGQGLNVPGAFDGSVRSYKLGVVMTDGTKFYRALKGGATEATKGDTATWEVLPGGYAPVVVSPGHRPFFASAGPDGDFRSPDDNLYSFGE